MNSEKSYLIRYNSTRRVVEIKWNGYSTSAQFREGAEAMLRMLAANKACKLLVDAKNMLLIGMEDQKWTVEDFMPRALSKGFKAAAVVKPTDYFNAVAIQSLIDQATRASLTVAIFDTLEQASVWLSTVQCG